MLRIISPTCPDKGASHFVVLTVDIESGALLDQPVRKCGSQAPGLNLPYSRDGSLNGSEKNPCIHVDICSGFVSCP